MRNSIRMSLENFRDYLPPWLPSYEEKRFKTGDKTGGSKTGKNDPKWAAKMMEMVKWLNAALKVWKFKDLKKVKQ